MRATRTIIHSEDVIGIEGDVVHDALRLVGGCCGGRRNVPACQSVIGQSHLQGCSSGSDQSQHSASHLKIHRKDLQNHPAEGSVSPASVRAVPVKAPPERCPGTGGAGPSCAPAMRARSKRSPTFSFGVGAPLTTCLKIYSLVELLHRWSSKICADICI